MQNMLKLNNKNTRTTLLEWSSCSPMFFKLGVLINIHRKTPVLGFLFNKLAGLKACNLNKKRLPYRCFPVNIEKFLRSAFLIEHVWWLLLIVARCSSRLGCCGNKTIQSQCIQERKKVKLNRILFVWFATASNLSNKFYTLQKIQQ